MPPRVADRIRDLQDKGRLRVLAGRIRDAVSGTGGIDVAIDKRGGGRECLRVARIVNCTGPHSNYAALEYPLLANLRRRGLLVPDALGLGIETEDCSVIGRHGLVSSWLFALGSLTRPAWWEITAVPEINVQTSRLVRKLAAPAKNRPEPEVLLADEFVDLGAGI
jgi:uncharacterized NAD(P)/FAD-binding protein YdhS